MWCTFGSLLLLISKIFSSSGKAHFLVAISASRSVIRIDSDVRSFPDPESPSAKDPRAPYI